LIRNIFLLFLATNDSHSVISFVVQSNNNE
jgi:hypothetical protein